MSRARGGSPAARLAGWVVRAYQRLTEGRPSPCRYVPSCSSYAAEALEVHGALRGGPMALRRLLRCHPWSDSGWDPVPSITGELAPDPSEPRPSECGVVHRELAPRDELTEHA